MPQLQLNISENGVWRKHQEINGVEPSLAITNRPITPIKTTSLRLIPITDRKMPVCIRTELFGCYLDEKVTIPSKKSSDFLTNGATDDFEKFSGRNSVLNFEWPEPRKLTSVDIFSMVRSTRNCITSVALESGEILESVKFDECQVTGQSKLQLPFGHTVTELQIRISYKAVLLLSEVKFHEEQVAEATVRQIESTFLESYINFGLMIIGGLILILVIFCLTTCLRSKFKSRRKWPQSEVLVSTPEFVPHQFSQKTKFSYNGSPLITHHEYSEIGSVAADSGRGASISEYAQVHH